MTTAIERRVTGAGAAPIRAALGFVNPASTVPDTGRRGLLRAPTMADPDAPDDYAFEDCALYDWSMPGAQPLGLDSLGFDSIELAGLDELQSTLEKVRLAGEIGEDDAAAIRRGLRGRLFRPSGGGCLRFLSIAPEGLIMRVAGPDGLQPGAPVERGPRNGHTAAINVHGDQDVRGTPLRQLMRGAAPWLFRHRSPDGSNRLSPLMLVNLWIPLQQITRPLVLMDRRTLDQRRHQVRYALPTDSFLDRGEDTRVNDIWVFLHDPAQRWYFRAQMDSRTAYVFDTLGTPHASTCLPGEALAARCYRALQALVDGGTADEIGALAAESPPPGATAPLAAAIAAMQGLLRDPPRGDGAATWRERAALAMDRVVRKSIEMRVVALYTPDVWPLNRERG